MTCILLSACSSMGGNREGSYMITGNVTGLEAGRSLDLLINGKTRFTLSTSGGSLRFSGAFPSGTSYRVAVSEQPPGETCAVSNGSGIIGTADVTNIEVACTGNPSQTYAIGGSATGLHGAVLLQNNGRKPLKVSGNGNFSFPNRLFDQASYDVTVSRQPAGQQCVVTEGTGTVRATDVNAVAVQCSDILPTAFAVGGTIDGLAGSVTLQNAAAGGTSRQTFSAAGPFHFAGKIAHGAKYDVTVATQPNGEICTVDNGTGSIGSAEVANIAVHCNALYSVGGIVRGLFAGNTIGLLDNGIDATTLHGIGQFLFPTRIAAGSAYRVTVGTQPAYQTCAVTHGAGTLAANLTGVTVDCAGTETLLHSFPGASEGANPFFGRVAIDAQGVVYATTQNGGLYGHGAVIRVMNRAMNRVMTRVTTGATTGAMTNDSVGPAVVLYSFTGRDDGGDPDGGILLDPATGNLYGTTAEGGANHLGTVFVLTPNPATGKGTEVYTESVIHAFAGAADGANPDGLLIRDAAGNLYGTTPNGGAANCAGGCGTVFQLTPLGTGRYGENILHAFTGAADGANPRSVELVRDQTGNLYGTTVSGGAHDLGTVFELAPDNTGHYVETVLHSFAGDAVGNPNATPPASGVPSTANVPAPAVAKGSSSGNTDPESPGTNAPIAADGAAPFGGLLLDPATGSLYGTTILGGGPNDAGVVFRLARDPTGAYAETVVHSFAGGTDGMFPYANLALDRSGNLYGTTAFGGGSAACDGGCGTVFRVSPNGTETVLHAFGSQAADGTAGGTAGQTEDGVHPYSGLAIDATAQLLGATYGGGTNDAGALFDLRR